MHLNTETFVPEFFTAVSQQTFKQHLLSFISNLFSVQHFFGAVKNEGGKKANMKLWILSCAVFRNMNVNEG